MLAAPPGLLKHRAEFSLGYHQLISAILCTINRMLMHYVFHYLLPPFFFSLTHSHLPQCWTAFTRPLWLKEMSVHSLITPPRIPLCSLCFFSHIRRLRVVRLLYHVFDLILLSSYLMSLHSVLTALFYPVCPPLPLLYWGGWPQLARRTGRAMPEGVYTAGG